MLQWLKYHSPDVYKICEINNCTGAIDDHSQPCEIKAFSGTYWEDYLVCGLWWCWLHTYSSTHTHNSKQTLLVIFTCKGPINLCFLTVRQHFKCDFRYFNKAHSIISNFRWCIQNPTTLWGAQSIWIRTLTSTPWTYSSFHFSCSCAGKTSNVKIAFQDKAMFFRIF